ncbi:MAG: fumarylacetoacetate hydrolase family protein [Burkholderiaceae bacterium]|nr:fumarylacetoacetate hydrolase family protein [Burkholderiaceae bacterium]
MQIPTPIGTVYGTLLNHQANLAALRAQGDLAASVYKALPQAPVLYIKTANTVTGPDARVEVPADAPELEAGATLGLVIARTATAVTAAQALSHLAGYVLINDLTVPHASVHRPPVRHRNRDGFCPIGALLPTTELADPQRLEIVVKVNGQERQRFKLDALVRGLPRLLADVTEFMTLQAGDVLHVGVPEGAPRVRAGDVVTIEAAGFAPLTTHLVTEGAI